MSRYLSCAETAKLIRGQLKKHFPGTKFSVRSYTYAGGASINVNWTDGPNRRDVEAVTDSYAGGRFDGMIDMAFNVSHYLAPDGSATIASSPGSTGSMGCYSPISEEPPVRDGVADEVVHFGSDYVFCNRDMSAAMKARIEAAASPDEYELFRERYGGYPPDQFVQQVFWAPENHPVTAYRAGLIDTATAVAHWYGFTEEQFLTVAGRR